MTDQPRYTNVLRVFQETPWAVLPSTFDTMAHLLKMRIEGGSLSQPDIEARIEAAGGRRGSANQVAPPTVAVIPLYGVIMPKASLFSQMSGAQSLEDFRASLQQAVDDTSISAIVIDIDSPGGQTDMVTETAQAVRDARAQKDVVAVASTLAASAAYWIASQATELIVTPSGAVGSVGVFCVHEDWSKALDMKGIDVSLIHAGQYKVDGNQYQPLSDSARSYLQDWVDATYTAFVNDVASGRGVSAKKVIDTFGGGRLVRAADAVSAGMADKVDTLGATIARLLGGRPTSKRGLAAEATPLSPEGATDTTETIAAMEAALKSAAAVITNPPTPQGGPNE